MGKIKVAAYCRVSTSTKDQLNSFENQQAYFQREISKNPDMELVEIYADKGLSGTTISKRKEFLRMLYDAGVDWEIIKGKVVLTQSERHPLFNRILVSNTSRFARNILAVDALRELKKKGVYIDFLDSSKTSENESDEVFIQMLISFAEQESRDKSIKVRFGQKESAMKGVIFTNKTIYGYNYIPDTNQLEIIPEEAEVIRTIFELYANGEGIRRIIEILDERGITTRQGKRFAKSTISRILGNEKYCGNLVRNRLTTGDFLNKLSSHKIKPKEEWIVHEGKVPPIVSKELFEKVQQLRDGKVHTQLQRGVNKGKSEFAGFIRCGNCGKNYIRNRDNGRLFYNCSTKKTRGTKVCDNPNVQMRQIENLITVLQNGALYEIFLNSREENIKFLLSQKEKNLEKIDKDTASEVNQLTIKLQKKNEEKNRLAILFVQGGYDMEQLESLGIAIDKEISILQQQINELSKTNKEILDEIKEIDKTIVQIQNLELNNKHTRDEVLDTIKAIVVYKGDEDAKSPSLNLEFKAFDLMNRIMKKYHDSDEINTVNTILNLEYNMTQQNISKV